MAYCFDSSQYIFDRALLYLWITLKLIFKLIVYIPLWFVGYMLTTTILEKADSALIWLSLIFLFAALLYQVVFFIKGITLGLMSNHNMLWIPLLALCVSFTCIFPAWLIFNYTQSIFYKISPESGNILTWITSIAFGIYVYSRYHFLTNIAPLAALPAYQLGINIVSKSTNAKPGIQYF